MGVPTGGSLCVQLANITVFYFMNNAVYSKPEIMANVVEAKRYIDDGAGLGNRPVPRHSVLLRFERSTNCKRIYSSNLLMLGPT